MVNLRHIVCRTALALLVLAGAGLVAGAAPALAQQVPQGVLWEVEADAVEDGYQIRIGFGFVAVYQEYFPHVPSRQVVVRLKRFMLGRFDPEMSLYGRESAVLPERPGLPRMRVTYEGNGAWPSDRGGPTDPGGDPWVVLEFDHPVRVVVGQGSDYRSLVVTVKLPEPGAGSGEVSAPAGSAVPDAPQDRSGLFDLSDPQDSGEADR